MLMYYLYYHNQLNYMCYNFQLKSYTKLQIANNIGSIYQTLFVITKRVMMSNKFNTGCSWLYDK